jgi:hypothetical protein
VIGAPTTQPFGGAYAFVQSGATWSVQQQLLPSDPQAGDAFGTAVALSGNTALVGSQGKNNQTGAAYVFTRSGGIWSQQQELTASDGAAFEFFGTSVALNDTTALIAASGGDPLNPRTGAVYVFTRAPTGTTWSQQQKLQPSDVGPQDFFGGSVALSGNTALVGASANNTGAVYVFVSNGGMWSQQQRLVASDPVAGDGFGVVALAGDTAIIGAAGKNAATGAVYVFARSGSTWSQVQELVASDGAPFHEFGSSVAVSGSTALIGAAPNGNGSFYLFARNGTQWSQAQEVLSPDGAANDSFGGSIALGAHTVLVGAAGHNSQAGAAYFYTGPVPGAPALGNKAPLLGLILVLAGVATLSFRRRRSLAGTVE